MTDNQKTNGASGPEAVPLRFEAAVLPVADVDRSKAFYAQLGWRLDADFAVDEHWRIVQFTPPGSPASIQFGTGVTQMTPGSVEGLYLIVDDIDAALADLSGHGASVSEVWHGRGPGTEGHEPGRDPKGGSYTTFASFADPDGNTYLLQEIQQRLPGRVEPAGSGELAQLLHETSEKHGAYEAVAPPHDWWDWYAAYFEARQGGSSSEEASAIAGRYMADVKHVVVPSA
jgi:catechol 2,3-dioxygenase-like lactoylglutathione lyase family enzyme